VTRNGPSAAREGRLGDKLGPRLAHIMADAAFRSRVVLAPHEARVRQAATQALIDRAGLEFAGVNGPILEHLLRERGDKMHPLMADHLQRISSGEHQWEAIAGHLQMGAVGALSSVLSNVTFPAVSLINLADRNLVVDQQTGAQAAAAGIRSYELGQRNAGMWGYTEDAFAVLYALAQNVPTPDIVGQLVNRGDMSEERGLYWTGRNAVPEELRSAVLGLRRQLLSPADAALAVLRGTLSDAEGRAVAARNGVDAADFATLLSNTGEPLGLMQLLEAYRRGFIDEATLKRGILQSRVRDEWIPTAVKLRYAPVPTADAVDAALRGHLGWDAAAKIADQNGVEPDQFTILRANAGSPPADMQLLELWRRGVIDSSQVDTGLRFGRLRDEWIPAIKQLRDEPLPTADTIDAWLRGHLSREAAEAIVRENGLLARDIPAAFANAGNPLALGQLLEALRRGFIDESQFQEGFRQSRYRDSWAATALRLRYSPMSTADALAAAVQNFLPLDKAKQVAEQNGLEAADFQVLYDTTGEPLSRTELEELYNRGKIDRATVVQGLRESRLKDKYVQVAVELHERLPEPRLVVNALTDGVIRREEAESWLAQAGYPPAVVAMLIATGEVRATGPHTQIAAGEVQTLYSDRLITYAEAEGYLTRLHYSADSITVLLGLADYRAHQKILSQGISAVRAHYLAYRITDDVAAGDLQAMNVPAQARAQYLQVWKLERLAHPKQLTAAQLVKAAKTNLFCEQGTMSSDDWAAANQRAGCERLVALGYSVDDAKLLLAGA
jgi:hypothetical protein